MVHLQMASAPATREINGKNCVLLRRIPSSILKILSSPPSLPPPSSSFAWFFIPHLWRTPGPDRFYLPVYQWWFNADIFGALNPMYRTWGHKGKKAIMCSSTSIRNQETEKSIEPVSSSDNRRCVVISFFFLHSIQANAEEIRTLSVCQWLSPQLALRIALLFCSLLKRGGILCVHKIWGEANRLTSI